MTIALALISSLMWGVADFLGGNLSKRNPVRSVVWISQAAGLTAIAFFGVTQGFDFSAPVLLWGSIASVTGYVGLMAFYKALSIGRMGIVSPIAALGVLVPLGVGLFAGDTLSSLQIFGMIIAVIGIVLASGPELSGLASAKPVWLALLSALGFGLCLAAIAKGSTYDAISTMTMMRLQTVTVGFFVWLKTRDRIRFAKADVLPLITIGIFDIGANLTFGLAAAGGYLSIVSVLGSLYPVVTVLLAWQFLKERLMPVQYVGVVFALAGVAGIAGG